MKLTLKELQALETEMLKEVAEICERHKIDYFLAYGSALGAIRHEGPIPWDNDADIAVPENQFLIFVETIRKELSDRFFLDFHDINQSYSGFIPRIGLKGYSTKFLHIDVYRITGAPQELADQVLLNNKVKNMKRIMQYKNIKEGYFSFDKISLKSKLIIYLRAFFVLFISKRKVIQKFENLCLQYPYEYSQTSVNIAGGYGIREFIPKVLYGKGVLVNYSGSMMKIPELYKDYLQHFYGNYLNFPSEEEQSRTDKVYQIKSLK